MKNETNSLERCIKIMTKPYFSLPEIFVVTDHNTHRLQSWGNEMSYSSGFMTTTYTGEEGRLAGR